jgi:hypothetical protein
MEETRRRHSDATLKKMTGAAKQWTEARAVRALGKLGKHWIHIAKM